jgi:hypothetical protein
MQTIWKYELELTDVQQLRMPLHAVILSVAYQRNLQEQRDMLCLWALVDPTRSHVPRTIEIHGTGNHSIDPQYTQLFIGTVPMPNGLVWHVFERVPQ